MAGECSCSGRDRASPADLPLPQLADFERLSAIGRVATAEEIARAIVFVALENRYVTGQVFPGRGGL